MEFGAGEPRGVRRGVQRGGRCEREGGVCDGVSAIVWLEAKGKKKKLISVFFLGGTSGNRDGGGVAHVPLQGL